MNSNLLNPSHGAIARIFCTQDIIVAELNDSYGQISPVESTRLWIKYIASMADRSRESSGGTGCRSGNCRYGNQPGRDCLESDYPARTVSLTRHFFHLLPGMNFTRDDYPALA
jgi:hypothetical protein